MFFFTKVPQRGLSTYELEDTVTDDFSPKLPKPELTHGKHVLWKNDLADRKLLLPSSSLVFQAMHSAVSKMALVTPKQQLKFL